MFGDGYALYTTQFLDFFFERFSVFPERPGIVKHQYLFSVITDLPVPDKIKLVVYDDSSDDEDNGNAILKHHQAAAQPTAFETLCQFAFEKLNGLKSRKIKCRVAAGDAAHHQYQDQ